MKPLRPARGYVEGVHILGKCETCRGGPAEHIWTAGWSYAGRMRPNQEHTAVCTRCARWIRDALNLKARLKGLPEQTRIYAGEDLEED